ncbi:MAG TPA: BrnT family toxin [bacterium]|nr:BrnT family toxin [bacterium]
MFSRFEWDEAKNKSNRTKHGVWFEEAQSVFYDPKGLFSDDYAHSDEEDRYFMVGMSSAARVLVVIHCYRDSGECIRIISARKATRKEIQFYAKGI